MHLKKMFLVSGDETLPQTTQTTTELPKSSSLQYLELGAQKGRSLGSSAEGQAVWPSALHPNTQGMLLGPSHKKSQLL